MISDDFLDYLDAAVAKNGLKQLARQVGMNPGNLSRIVNRVRPPSREQMDLLGAHLGLRIVNGRPAKRKARP